MKLDQMPKQPADTVEDVGRKAGRRAWHDPDRNPVSLWCGACRDRSLCGGIAVQKGVLDCLSFCCHKPTTCDRVCRNNPDFVHRIWEVDGLDLSTVPRYARRASPSLPLVAPLLFHGGSRQKAATLSCAVLPLYGMLNRADGGLRFESSDHLARHYRIEPGGQIVLTGTDQDPPLERWWRLGELARRSAIRDLRILGVSVITTPNYSLIADRPRWDDMHAMKRIAQVHWEFGDEGITAVLHVNARTETDMRRWGEYLAKRPEITHIAYEFTTGTRYLSRRLLHLSWLTELARSVGRSLHIVVRGGAEVLPPLVEAFAGVTVLESSAFMKTMMRQRGEFHAGRLKWFAAPTALGEPLDDLFAANLEITNRHLIRLMMKRDLSASPISVPA